jgi:hypothetical protein
MSDGLTEAERMSKESLDRLNLYCEMCPSERSCKGCTDWREEIEQ